MEEVRWLREQGIIPSSNLQKSYWGFITQIPIKPINTNKLKKYYHTIVSWEEDEIQNKIQDSDI